MRSLAVLSCARALNPIRMMVRPALLGFLVTLACPIAFASETITDFAHTAWGVREGAPRGIMAIAQTTDGYIWLGARDGLFRFDGVSFENYEPPLGPQLPNGSVTNLVALPNGDLWVGLYAGYTIHLSKGRAQIFSRYNGGSEGILIFSGLNAEARCRRSRVSRYASPRLIWRRVR
jgi:ligand-binding sensor domain-containing protein